MYCNVSILIMDHPHCATQYLYHSLHTTHYINHYTLYTISLTTHYTPHCTHTQANIFGLLFSIFAAIPELEVQMLATVCVSLHRIMLFAVLFAYILHKFGHAHFGKLTGVAALVRRVCLCRSVVHVEKSVQCMCCVCTNSCLLIADHSFSHHFI